MKIVNIMNQKVNGHTFPRTIRTSAFAAKLDVEGCDPLALPLAALLYQQASNFWLRKLAHGRMLHLIPSGLLSRSRNRGIDLDRISQIRARLLDRMGNT